MAPDKIATEIRLAEPTDLDRISAFLPELGGPSFNERHPGKTAQDFYRWKYFANPLGNAIVGIAVAGELVVSLVAAVPKRIWVSGNTVPSYELGDFLTNGNYRGKGLFSQLIELVCGEAAAKGAPLVYVRPNDVSFPILAGRLSFYEAQRLCARRFVVPSFALANATGIPAPLLRGTGMDWLLRVGCIPGVRTGSLTVVPIQRFGVETDRLWEKAAAGYDFALVRDSDFLNWRFTDSPTPYKMWLALRKDQAVGFVVASTSEAVSTAHIVDLFAESGDKETVEALLATSIDSLLRRGFRTVHTWTVHGPAQSAAQDRMQSALPFRRKRPLHLAFRILRPQDIALPLPSQKWHFTLGDSDGA